MPTNTYVALDTQTLTSTAATVIFSSIPQGYTDLVLISRPLVTSSAYDLVVRFNGDTASNYSNTILSGTGSSAISAKLSNQTIMYLDYYGVIDTTQTNRIINIMNYSNSTTYKTVLSRANNAGSGTDAIVGLWRNTAAITSLVLIAQTGGTFAAGSTFSLYGIASEVWAAKATGGTITNDVQYTYHTFTSSGTFTPTQSLTCDYLIIAGGGGGAGQGGGGGAGGYRNITGSSLSATGYAVTVGGGGAGGAADTSGSGNAGTKGSDSVFNSFTSTGGGLGSNNYATATLGSGGSGGGAGLLDGTNSTGAGNTPSTSPSQGSNGGSGTAGNFAAGAVGGNGSSSAAGAGGAGSNSLSTWATVTNTGVSGFYAGGGGGGSDDNGYPAAGGAGGSGGGGAGRRGNATAGGAGTANTGSGGGGSGNTSGNVNVAAGGAGGSGIVIIRYAN